MANKYLAREDAPFDASVWELLDEVMKRAATDELAGRRLLHVEGPFGLGLKTIPLQDEETEQGLIVSNTLPVPMLQEEFTLNVRDLANYEQDGFSFDRSAVSRAAIACARREDALIFDGAPGIPGLRTAEGVATRALSSWEEVGAAANDVLQAVTTLDEAGFHGPYCLALAPARYNLLFRLYKNGRQSEIEHLRTIVTDGIHKAPALQSGGVLLASAQRYASIILGQDMAIGFIGPAGDKLEFLIRESLVPRIWRPEAIVVLQE